VEDLLQSFLQIVYDLGKFSGILLQLILNSALLIAWVAWWLWAVNWKNTWPVLRQGAWVPLVLLVVAGALAWSQISPSDLGLPGALIVPNFWWQLGAVSLLTLLTLFCGWLQGVFGWTPPEINLEPAAPAGDHGHNAH
jgi:magnesium-transporting ATPase (P-type)